MEYLETTIGCLIKYVEYLENYLISNIKESMEREDMIKPFNLSRKIINFISDTSEPDLKENILNEIYIILRKNHLSLDEYISSNSINHKNCFNAFKSSCIRNEIYLKSIYEDLLNSFEKTQIKKDSINFSFLLKMTFTNIPNSVENLYSNLIQFKDEVFYIKTADFFGFFYFVRTKEGCWYWSPPKKTDKEDLWIITPNTKIEAGYWIDKKIPNQVEQFIIWLDIFKPNIPSFYLKKKEKVKIKMENDPEGKYEKLADNMDLLEEQMKKDKCFIF